MAPSKKTTRNRKAAGNKKPANPNGGGKATKKTARKITAPQAQEPPRTGFFSLPAELRDEIYELVAETTSCVGVKDGRKARITAATPVLLLSRTTRSEFYKWIRSAATTTATRVKIQVVDLDFSAAMTYFTRIIDSSTADLRDFHLTTGRKVGLELSFTKTFCTNPDVEKLAKYNRFVNAKLHGFEVAIFVGDVADALKTRKVIDMMISGGDPPEWWIHITREFARWEKKEPAPQLPAQTPGHLDVLEQAVQDEYDAMYAQLDNSSVAFPAVVQDSEDDRCDVEVKMEEDEDSEGAVMEDVEGTDYVYGGVYRGDYGEGFGGGLGGWGNLGGLPGPGFGWGRMAQY